GREGFAELQGGRFPLALVDLEPAEVGLVEAVADRNRERRAQAEKGEIAPDIQVLSPRRRAGLGGPHGAPQRMPKKLIQQGAVIPRRWLRLPLPPGAPMTSRT